MSLPDRRAPTYKLITARLLLFSLCVNVLPTTSLATPTHFDVEIGTELPVALGVTASTTWFDGLRVSTGLGYLPKTYVELINEVVQQFPDSYDAATGDLIEETLQSSLIWRTHLGWQWRCGLYVDGGYSLVTLGGGTSTESLIAGLTEYEADDFSASDNQYSVSSVLHMADLELGWKWLIGKQWTLRTALGVAVTFAASSTVDSNAEPNTRFRRQVVEGFESYSERYLVDTYEEYVITPVFTLALGYRIF